MVNALKVNDDEVVIFSRRGHFLNIDSYKFSDIEKYDEWVTVQPLEK